MLFLQIVNSKGKVVKKMKKVIALMTAILFVLGISVVSFAADAAKPAVAAPKAADKAVAEKKTTDDKAAPVKMTAEEKKAAKKKAAEDKAAAKKKAAEDKKAAAPKKAAEDKKAAEPATKK